MLDYFEHFALRPKLALFVNTLTNSQTTSQEVPVAKDFLSKAYPIDKLCILNPCREGCLSVGEPPTCSLAERKVDDAEKNRGFVVFFLFALISSSIEVRDFGFLNDNPGCPSAFDSHLVNALGA